MTRYLLGYVAMTLAAAFLLVLFGAVDGDIAAALATTAIIAGVTVGRDAYRAGRKAGPR